MARSASAHSNRSAASRLPPMVITVWPCWCAEKTRPWPNCSSASISPSASLIRKTSSLMKSTPQPPKHTKRSCPLRNFVDTTDSYTQQRRQHGHPSTLTKWRQITNDLNDYWGVSLTADERTIATSTYEGNYRFGVLSLAEPS